MTQSARELDLLSKEIDCQLDEMLRFLETGNPEPTQSESEPSLPLLLDVPPEVSSEHLPVLNPEPLVQVPAPLQTPEAPSEALSNLPAPMTCQVARPEVPTLALHRRATLSKICGLSIASTRIQQYYSARNS